MPSTCLIFSNDMIMQRVIDTINKVTLDADFLHKLFPYVLQLAKVKNEEVMYVEMMKVAMNILSCRRLLAQPMRTNVSGRDDDDWYEIEIFIDELKIVDLESFVRFNVRRTISRFEFVGLDFWRKIMFITNGIVRVVLANLFYKYNNDYIRLCNTKDQSNEQLLMSSILAFVIS